MCASYCLNSKRGYGENVESSPKSCDRSGKGAGGDRIIPASRHLLVNPGPHLSPPTRSLAVEQSTTILSLPQVDTSLFIVDPCVTSQYSLSINISAVLVLPFKCLVRELCIDIPGAPPPVSSTIDLCTFASICRCAILT
jgi:hypothetical protein